ncbi:hypothetical protein [Oceanisphaera avium]|uniref:hypothetical protein n=1 Tax=Oceanisphaera avium TaxID=1903694 RepID=UPI0018E0552C|nr:hypothetical protein [Oceanisphaera avium]
MRRLSLKHAPLCVALSLFALPAMADNIFSGVINFGREILDETRKMAPGIQNDRRHEEPTKVQAPLNDGRDNPAVDYTDANVATAQPAVGASSNVIIAPPQSGQPTGANLNYTYGQGQRSTTSKANRLKEPSSSTHNQGGWVQETPNQAETHNNANFGWQEEDNLQ